MHLEEVKEVSCQNVQPGHLVELKNLEGAWAVVRVVELLQAFFNFDVTGCKTAIVLMRGCRSMWCVASPSLAQPLSQGRVVTMCTMPPGVSQPASNRNCSGVFLGGLGAASPVRGDQHPGGWVLQIYCPQIFSDFKALLKHGARL